MTTESERMKILLVCGAGASSGFVAQAMRRAAKQRGLDVEITARSDSELLGNIQGANLLMVGPHLAFNLDNIRREVEPFGVEAVVIDQDAYGALDGDRVLQSALDAMGGRDAKVLTAATEVSAESKTVTEPSADEQRGFFGWMNRSVAPKLNRITGNRYVASIQESIMTILPMIMIGSVASIVGVVRQVPGLEWLPDISLLSTFSFGLVALFVAFLLPIKVMERRGNQKLKWSASLTSVSLFLLVAIPGFDADAGTIGWIQEKMGSGGLLAAIAVGAFTSLVFNLASKRSLFKEDTQMPDIVVNWVDALIPVAVCLTVGMLLYTSGFDLLLTIRGIFAPIALIAQSLPGMILFSFLTVFLYSFGFTWILFPIVWVVWMDAIAANQAAAAAGLAATNVNLMETFHGLMYIGGEGASLTLVALMLFSQSKRLKAIGRITIVPSMFNISEPVMFGAPVVWNPLLMIPLWINSILLPIITYIALVTGFAPIPTHPFQMWFLPVWVQAYFGTGSLMSVLLCLILTAVTVLVWLPFFKAYERQEVAKERREARAHAEAAARAA